ncbi:hypothetical protein HDU93_001269, partial [Gonapodya sp. JEL0774]
MRDGAASLEAEATLEAQRRQAKEAEWVLDGLDLGSFAVNGGSSRGGQGGPVIEENLSYLSFLPALELGSRAPSQSARATAALGRKSFQDYNKDVQRLSEPSSTPVLPKSASSDSLPTPSSLSGRDSNKAIRGKRFQPGESGLSGGNRKKQRVTFETRDDGGDGTSQTARPSSSSGGKQQTTLRDARKTEKSSGKKGGAAGSGRAGSRP